MTAHTHDTYPRDIRHRKLVASLTLLYLVQYVLRSLHNTAVAVVVLVLYCLLFILALASYLRVFFAIQRDPGFVPLLQDIPSKSLDPAEKKGRKSRSSRLPDPETASWCPPDTDLDSPGLETFYSRDVFSCEVDGRPRWCSNCRQWKPDRAHHSSELGRCVRKMDHLCPWVGGMVSETCECHCPWAPLVIAKANPIQCSIQLFLSLHLLRHMVLCALPRHFGLLPHTAAQQPRHHRRRLGHSHRRAICLLSAFRIRHDAHGWEIHLHQHDQH